MREIRDKSGFQFSIQQWCGSEAAWKTSARNALKTTSRIYAEVCDIGQQHELTRSIFKTFLLLHEDILARAFDFRQFRQGNMR